MPDILDYPFRIDRRSGNDRRKRKIPDFALMLINGNREHIRREADREKFAFFDRYNSRLLSVILIILFLSVCDSLLTLFLIGNGSQELNPVMDYFLNISPWAFITAKYLLTSVGVVILLIFQNYYYPRIKSYARHFLVYAAGIFALVVLWELSIVYYLLYL